MRHDSKTRLRRTLTTRHSRHVQPWQICSSRHVHCRASTTARHDPRRPPVRARVVGPMARHHTCYSPVHTLHERPGRSPQGTAASSRRRAREEARADAAAADEQEVGVKVDDALHVLVGLHALAQLARIIRYPGKEAAARGEGARARRSAGKTPEGRTEVRCNELAREGGVYERGGLLRECKAYTEANATALMKWGTVS